MIRLVDAVQEWATPRAADLMAFPAPRRTTAWPSGLDFSYSVVATASFKQRSGDDGKERSVNLKEKDLKRGTLSSFIHNTVRKSTRLHSCIL